MEIEHAPSCEVANSLVADEIEQAVGRVAPQLKSLRWLPWIGRSYGASGIFGDKRVLVLGESHYEWCQACDSAGKPRSSSLTCRCVAERVLEDKNSIQHWKLVEYALTGGPLDDMQRPQFWNSIAYYNFVQGVVGYFGGGPDRPRPSPQLWASSTVQFQDLLKELVPDLVVVLGFTLWKYLPAGEDLPSLHKGGKELLLRRVPRLSGSPVLACRVRHPAAGLGRTWFPVIQEAIGVGPRFKSRHA